ncbi:MAG TPA: hypothetical protein PKD90_02595 [Phnomibacter sp.]|nr:hypothetical protein [Phnomibacter sp.]
MQDAGAYQSLLRKYLQGIITSREQQMLFAITQSGRYDHLLGAEINAWKQNEWLDVSPWTDERTKEQIYSGIRENILQEVSKSKQKGSHRLVRWRALSAAAVVVAGIVWTEIWMPGNHATMGANNRKEVAGWLIHLNVTRSVRLAHLEGSSRVRPWPGAELRFQVTDNGGARRAELKGSAEFDIRHRKGQLFVVQN